MPIQIQSTRVVSQTETQSTVELLIADQFEQEDAEEFVSIRVKIEHEALPVFEGLQLEALRRVRDILGAQTQPLAQRLNRRF